MTRQTIEISGMSCHHCVMTVRNVLSHVEGVTVEEVRIGEAKVSFDESAVPSDVVAEAVRDAGYDVVAVR
jgi:copper chaperone